MSRIVKTPSIVLNAMSLGPSSTGAAVGGIINLTPNINFSWTDELTWYITVGNITGTPTGGGLLAKFQIGSPHTGFSGSSTFPLSGPTLTDLDPAQKATFIIEGEDWPSPVASYNQQVSGAAMSNTNPLTVMRTIKHFGAFCNLQLDTSTLTGGTNPAFTISVVLIQKGS